MIEPMTDTATVFNQHVAARPSGGCDAANGASWRAASTSRVAITERSAASARPRATAAE